MIKEHSNSELLQRLVSSDSRIKNEAVRCIYLQCSKSIVQMVLNNSGSEQDAEDIFQDALVILFIKVRKGEFKLESSLKTYLFAVARNLWLKRLRKNRLPVPDDQPELAYSMETEKFIQNKQLTVRRALEQIGESCKSLLQNFYFEKMSMSDIALKYDLGSEEAARNKKYRCMQKLIAFVKARKFNKDDFSLDD